MYTSLIHRPVLIAMGDILVLPKNEQVYVKKYIFSPSKAVFYVVMVFSFSDDELRQVFKYELMEAVLVPR